MYRNLLTHRLVAFALVLLVLAGCSGLPTSKPTVDPDVARAEQLYQQQDYPNAAAAYLALANRYQGAQKQHFLSLAADAYRALADLYRQKGDLPSSAQALQQRLGLLQTAEARLQQQIEILQTLNLMGTLALRQYPANPPETMGGWVQLALLSKQHRNNPAALRRAFGAWRSQYPGHPALLDELIAHQQQLYAQTETATHIGVLLPQTGKYAAVAEAIRDGMLVSLQQMPSDGRPILSFYDSNSTQAIWPLYHQAIEKGADFVIGPLQKESVTQLVRAGDLPVPVLALNIVDVDSTLPGNLYMYSLNPENEARQVAERMWQDNKRRPVALIPDNPWGQRLLSAFSQRWSELGGGRVSSKQYNPASYDHTAAIVGLLQINRSKARYAELKRWLGRPLEFVPSRRTDVDAVFLATREQQAAAFAPQFKYHMAGDLPIYTTSHVWRGSIRQQQLIDMRGIILPDIPLVAEPGTRAQLARDIPGIAGGLVRLYAMGMDAIALVPHLQRLQNSPGQSLEGQTGSLSMDASNRIERQLVWLKLDDPVQTLGYANRLDANATTVQAAGPAQDNPDATPMLEATSTIQQPNGSTTTR